MILRPMIGAAVLLAALLPGASAGETGRPDAARAGVVVVAQAAGTPSGTVELVIVNRSRSRIDYLEFFQGEGARAKLRHPLAGGHQTRLTLKGFTGCNVVYQVVYDQRPPASYEVDICKQSTVNVRNL